MPFLRRMIFPLSLILCALNSKNLNLEIQSNKLLKHAISSNVIYASPRGQIEFDF